MAAANNTIISSDPNIADVLRTGKIKFCIPNENKNCKKYLPLWTPIKYITCGSFGCVFQVCNKGKCDYIIKIILETPSTDDDDDSHIQPIDPQRELKMSMIAGDIDVGPKVHDMWNCEGIVTYANGSSKKQVLTFLVMDKMDINMLDYINSYKNKYNLSQFNRIKLNVNKLMKRLYDIGYIYTDIHAGNIMFKINPSTHDILEIRLVDFGSVVPNDFGRNLSELIKDVDIQLSSYDPKILAKWNENYQ